MAVNSYLSPIALILQAFTDQGVVLAGGLITTYVAGTTTPVTTYTDSTLSVANTNPIALSATGRLPSSVWLPAGVSHKMVLQTSTGGTITGGTVDNLTSINDPTNTYVNTFNISSFPSTSTIYLTRNANYTGGTVGSVYSLQYLITNAQAGIASNERTLMAVMNNSCTTSNTANNVAGYFQGNKASTGPTWAAVCEAQDKTATNNPLAGLVGIEVDVRSNGTDILGNRIGIDVVATRYNTAGATTYTSFGVRVGNNNDGANSLIGSAFSAYNCNVAVAFDCSLATVSSGSLRMAQNVPILFDVNGVTQLSYDGTALRYDAVISSVKTLQFKITPTVGGSFAYGLAMYGNTPIAQTTGIGTPTGAGEITNFPGATATLPQCSQTIAGILTRLKAFGLYGA